jgi:hypothetical protein
MERVTEQTGAMTTPAGTWFKSRHVYQLLRPILSMVLLSLFRCMPVYLLTYLLTYSLHGAGYYFKS